MSTETDSPAIVIKGATKRFKKRTVRREYTTLKSELVDFFLRRKSAGQLQMIEALRGIDLTVPRGKTIGILGRNGSGKSTLLKLMTGIFGPTDGTVQVNGRVSALLDLGAGFHPDFSGRENILINGIILGMTRVEVRARMEEIIAFSELGDFIDEPVRSYSSGMYMRLAFAVATYVDPDVLIIDEILAVGDEHFSKKSMARMTEFKRSGKTIVLVTHDLGTVERWCDLAAWIDGGVIREFGEPADVVKHYREAVRLMEASDKPFTPPALASDGGALPAVATESRALAILPTITAVRIKTVDGKYAQTLDSEAGCRFEVELKAPPDMERAVLSLKIDTATGLEAYRTTTDIDGVLLPLPMPETFVATVDIPRIGLVSGQYMLAFHVYSRHGTPGDRHSLALTITSARTDLGVYRPKKKWNLERPPERSGDDY